MTDQRLYHISEESDISTFVPRPSPSAIEAIEGDVVFAVSEKFLHNYLFPRNCPRVSYYTGPGSSEDDINKFRHEGSVTYVLNIEESWPERLKNTTLYIYEFSPETFSLLDECAGYYISYEAAKPVSVRKIGNPYEELMNRNDLVLNSLPNLWPLADEIVKSSLRFSLIRMRNALGR